MRRTAARELFDGAWDAANTNPGPDTITFNISPGGLQTISLTNELATATGPVTINGQTQPGFSNRPIIEIRGTAFSSLPYNGLQFQAHGNSIQGLIVDQFGWYGIYFSTGSSSNTVKGCWIGLDSSGTQNRGMNGPGLSINAGNYNVIGGTTAADRNVIAGNAYHGIYIGSGFGNVILGNYIGTDASGTNAIGNGYSPNGTGNVAGGVYVDGGGSNTIGGSVAGAGNLICGNTRGIALYSNTRGNIIQGNIIGPDASGSMKPPGASQLNGIDMYNAFDNVIGGTNVSARNIISCSGRPDAIAFGYGINMFGSATGNVIRGNFVGTDATGTQPLANYYDGIYLQNGANGNTIGGTATGAGNLISGNGQRGINIYMANKNTIQGNFIGTQSNRTSALGNGNAGIFIYGGNGNLIGGTTAGAGNVIAHNHNDNGYGGYGVMLSGSGVDALTTNTVRRNSIFDNAALGIHLFNASCYSCEPFNDAGDADTGPNQLQNFPVLVKATTSAGTINITGTINSAASANFIVEFYASPTLDPTGFGEGKTYLGTASVSTDGSGNGAFDSYFVDPGVSGQFITAIAIDLSGNSSEFSAAVIADSGAGAFVFQYPTWQIDESGGTAYIWVKRIAGSIGAASVNYSVTSGTAIAGSDFTVSSGVMNFADGETFQYFTVPIINDTLNELDETVLLSLSSPSGGALLLSPSNAVLTITDNDPLYFYALDAAVTKPAAGSTNLAMPITLSSPPAGPVTASVAYATADLTAIAGADYLSTSGTLTFANGSTQQFVNVTVLADGLQEGSKAFQITLSNPSNAQLGDGTSLATIYDGTQGVLQFSTSAWTIAENAGGITVTVTRIGGVLGAVSVPFSANAGSATAPADFALTNGTLSFGNGIATRTFAVQINDDTAIEGPETIFLELGTPTGTTLGNPPAALLTIIDNEPLPQLVIGGGTNALAIRWDTNAAVFRLYATPTMSPPAWTLITNTPATNGGNFQIIEPAISNRFYRLGR